LQHQRLKLLFATGLASNVAGGDSTYLDSGRMVDVDIVLKEMRVVIEYQGEQHYFDLTDYGSSETQYFRDQAKVRLISR